MLFINGVKDSEGNLTESFIDIFARGGKIDDWSKVSGGSEDLGAGYGLQFSGAATIWEAYQLGSEKTSMSEDVMKALAGKKQGHNWKAKRWMDYARRGVYTEYRNPKLIMSRDAKKSLIRVYRLKNLSPERAMFDWDRPLL